MSAIKKFFEKKKLEIKFKKAGDGKKLTDDYVPPSTSEKPIFVGSTSFTEEKQRAAEAAINRLSVKQEKKVQPSKAPLVAPNTSGAVHESTVLEEQFKVKFTCPLFENLALPRDEMELKINDYLYSQLPQEPGMVSALIIHTLNKNPDQVKQCIEMLDKYLTNIITQPQEEKYRRIKLSNKILSEKVLSVHGAESFLQSVGFVREMLEVNGVKEEYIVCKLEEDSVEKMQLAKEFLQFSEPITLQLDRDCKIYSPSNQASQMPSLSPEFFTISSEELKKEQELRKRAVEEAGMLMTKDMREKDRKRELRRFKYVLLRCRLPDGYIVQATFSARDSLNSVRHFISDCLEDESAEFHFFWQGRGRIDEAEELKSLAEIGLAPASLIEVADDRKGAQKTAGFLKASLALLAAAL